MLVTTPFFGREREIAELTNLLKKPTCRLVTLTGYGGIGKTRLAATVAQKLAQHYQGGVYFVDLQPVRAVEFLVSTIVTTVAPQLTGQKDLQAALFNTLKNKNVLLILDNFEHLLPGAEIVSALLAHTTRVDVLATSRQVLNLREEWRYAIEGLAVPESTADEQPEAYSAVQLFTTYAQRSQHSFCLEEEAAHVIRICQFVEGMPLAIEIAASWLSVLPCATIPDEIQRNLDFLTTPLRDVPERHRSIQAVFSQAWGMLSATEQRVLTNLSVFRGSFTLEAAEQVAGASLPVMANLIHKSLLDRQEDGRYRLHELLRQYADDRLRENPDAARQVYDQHCAYYTTFLSQRAETITGPQQVTVLHEIASEIEDIRNACQHVVDQGRLVENQPAFYTLIQFMDLQGRYLEAIQMLNMALSKLWQVPPSRRRDRLLATLLAMLGGDCGRVGRYDDARAACLQGTALLAALDESPPRGFGTDPQLGLALLEMIAGNQPAAVELAEQARIRCETDDDPLNGQIACYVLANARMAQGNHALARDLANDAHNLISQTGNRWMLANVYMLMGDIERALDHFDQARRYYQSSMDIKREMNDPEGMAFGYQRLGRVAYLQHDLDEAERLNRQSLALYRDIHDPGGLATTLNNLGDIAFGRGRIQQAVRYYCDALEIALEIAWFPLILLILTATQNILRHKQPERAVALLVYIQCTATERESWEAAQQVLDVLERELPAERFADASQRALSGDLIAIGREVLAELALLENDPHLLTLAASTHQQPSANEALIDPLTERELEVLALMAQGLTNRQIAEQLVVVLGTVKAHSHSIYSKLGVSNRVQAIKHAAELGIL